MSPEQLDGQVLDSRADIYALGAVLYHLIAGRPPFDAPSQAVMMNQIYRAPAPLAGLRSGVNEGGGRGRAQSAGRTEGPLSELGRLCAGFVRPDRRPQGCPWPPARVLDSERFNLLRSLDFFNSFGDVELWEVVHRAKWQRLPVWPCTAVARKGAPSHHCPGQRRVYRNSKARGTAGAGTSVGEMAYLAPSSRVAPPQHRRGGDRASDHHFLHPEAMQQPARLCRHLFDEAFIRVLVATACRHEALAHPRRIM